MNVLLLSTDQDVWTLGMRSIAAVLKRAGHHARLVYMPGKTVRYTAAELEQAAALAEDYYVVGLSCLAQGSDKSRQIAAYMRARGKLLVWGGVHASLMPESCAPHVDMVCLGEGEGMMLELMECLSQGQDWCDIANIVYIRDGTLHRNPVRPPISDLDALPLPDFSFQDEYHLVAGGFKRALTLPKVKESGRIILNGSRGCAFHCTYCCNARLKALYTGSQYVRRMSVARFIEHAAAMHRALPDGRYFYFVDEDFGARPFSEIEQFAEIYPRQVGLPFACMAHPARISRQVMDALTRSGAYQVHLGIESGSERTRREVFDRHVSNEVICRAADIISKYPQVTPFYFIIYGNPYEEQSDLLESIRLVASLPPGFVLQAYNLIFFPGSDLYERAVRDGLITGETDSGYEMNYLAGLNYCDHQWKRNNLYLNGLISLMDGSCSHRWLGLIPRRTLGWLISPAVVQWNEKHSWFIKTLIRLKVSYIQARKVAVRLLRKVKGNFDTTYRVPNAQPVGGSAAGK